MLAGNRNLGIRKLKGFHKPEDLACKIVDPGKCRQINDLAQASL
jgi:hypothetical protein